ncbi:MAG: ATP-binding protein, partial [Planctomycetota bacterium]
MGLVLHELATGSHPLPAEDFPSIMRRALQDEPPRAGAENPQISAFLEEVLLSLLEKDRDKRPADAATLAALLRQGEESTWWQRRARLVRRSTHEPLRRVRIPRETAVYGRDDDVAVLHTAWEDVLRGEGRVVLIEGEAGIGKTRLVDEFVEREQSGGKPLHFLFGSYPPGGAATSTGAFTTAYLEQFGEADLEAVVEQRLKVVPLLAPAFTALLKGEPPPAGALPLNKDSLQSAFIQATRHLASERPVILLVDDLHFAPEEGRELFAALAHSVLGQPVLLVGTARPGLPSAWKADIERLPQTSALSLSRLGVDDLEALLGDNLGSPHLGRELARVIERKSGGNPFFVFEIIRGLQEGQFLRKTRDGNWESVDLIRDIRLPDSVSDLVRARLDDLSQEDRDLLDVAACCGFEFDAGLLADAMEEKRIPLLRRLAAIEKDHRLVRSSGRRFVFEHHQFREVLYKDMPEALREEYHGALAEALETREQAADREPADLPGSLAHALCEQFLKGERHEAALRYLEPAMEHLGSMYLNEPAVELAERALGAADLVTGDRRVRVLVHQAARLDFLGRRDQQRGALDEAVEAADVLGDAQLRALTRSRLGGHLGVMGRVEEAIAVLQEALPLAVEAGDRETESVVLKNLGIALRNNSRPEESRGCLERLLAVARETGDRRSEASALGALGVGLWQQGELDEAETLISQHRNLARDDGDRRGEAVALGYLAGVRYRQGRYEEARANYEAQLEITRSIGDRRGEGTATVNLG